MANTNVERGKLTRNAIGLVLYLAGGWRTYQEIGEEFGWACGSNYKTARRNVRALEEAGLPIEWCEESPSRYTAQRMRLPPDWVARTIWLRRYIILKEIKK